MEREHVAYFDYLRFFGAVGVVFLHVASQPVGDGVINKEWVLLTVITTFSYTAVPLFFMMSGYLLLTSEKNEECISFIKTQTAAFVGASFVLDGCCDDLVNVEE